MARIETIPAAEVKRLAAAGATILDVRQPGEHAEQRLEAAHALVPLDRLDPEDFMLKRGLDKGAAVYLLCRSGMRAKTAAEKFVAAGYKNARVIEGGLLACAAGDIPVTGNAVTRIAAGTSAQTIVNAGAPKFIPLERQVRIGAGALVALGTLLGFYAAPAFYLLPFCVGLGLIYAGVTDRCGMALVLIRAPWNKGMMSASSAAAGAPADGLPKPPDAPTAGGCA